MHGFHKAGEYPAALAARRADLPAKAGQFAFWKLLPCRKLRAPDQIFTSIAVPYMNATPSAKPQRMGGDSIADGPRLSARVM